MESSWNTINCEINLILTSSENYVISVATGATKFKITDTKFNVPLETLSTQDNARLLQQLKSGFKLAINWNKYQSKVSIQAPNSYFDFLIDLSFQVVNKLFVSSLENKDDRTGHTGFHHPK